MSSWRRVSREGVGQVTFVNVVQIDWLMSKQRNGAGSIAFICFSIAPVTALPFECAVLTEQVMQVKRLTTVQGVRHSAGRGQGIAIVAHDLCSWGYVCIILMTACMLCAEQ